MRTKIKGSTVLTHKLSQKKKLHHPYNNSPSSQRARIVSWFSENKPRLSTTEAREILGVMHPAGRIQELKEGGHKIILNWTAQADANGVLHRAGEYVYLGCVKEESV